MSINVFYNIEHHSMPQIFYKNKTNFFMGAAYNKGFLHDAFNTGYKMAFKRGIVKKIRIFKEKDFKLSERNYDGKHKLLCIDLPAPKRRDKVDVYIKTYFISFLEFDNKIEVLDIYALQKRSEQKNVNLIVSFIEDDEKIVFRGVVDDNLKHILEQLYKIAFENFYPEITISKWQ